MLKEKLVLVTGASRGIGRAIALTLGAAGATVIGTATSDDGAENISKIFTENNILGKGMKLNVTDNEQITDLLKNITEDYGSIDILVNNAGITRDNILVRMKEDEWNDIINTNLTSVYKMSKSRGITVNAIAPGFIETDMTNNLPEDQKLALANQIPMGRLGTPNEIAQAVLFLAADSGSYITAQTLHINGGMYTL